MAGNQSGVRYPESGRYGDYDGESRYYGPDYDLDTPYWQYPGYDYHGSYPVRGGRANSVPPVPAWFPRPGGDGTRAGSGPPDFYSSRREQAYREAFARGGDYRGRGPKNYRRSDERIAEERHRAA